MILHLVAADDWAAAADPYVPPSLVDEGFVHATDDVPTLLQVANRFYRDLGGDVLVLVIDEAAVGAEVRREPPAHPDGSPPGAAQPRFPHVYGPIPHAAVLAVRRTRRTPDGTYVSIDES